MTELQIVHIFVPDKSVALAMATTLVNENLAACVSIIDDVTSVYKWQGKVETSSECLLMIKTVAANFCTLKERVRMLHPHECPCIISLNISEADASFARWVKDNSSVDS